MLIEEFAGKTQSGVLDVDQPIKDILIVKTDGLLDFVNEVISVKIVRKNGTSQTIVVNTKIKALSEIKQMGEGANKHDGAVRERSFGIGVQAGIALADGESINIELMGCEIGASYKIYGVQDFQNRRSIYNYGRDAVQAGKNEKIIQADQIQTLGINPTNVLSMEFVTADGISATYSKIELEYMQRQLNDIAITSSAPADLILVREDLIVLGINNVKTIKINTNELEVEYFVQTILNI